MSGERHGPLVRHEQVNIAEDSGWRKLPAIAAVVGVACLAGAFALKGGGAHEGASPAEVLHQKRFWFSYLTSLMFWLSLGLGGLIFVLIQHAARAGWSITSRRLAENMALALPVLGLLALPMVFLGAHDLFHWTHLDVVENDPMLLAKQPYLNESSFMGRALAFVGIWSILGVGYWMWSTKQDTAKDPSPLQHRMRGLAPIGILLFALSLTFGAFDWLMSLDPHWFSTIFGVYYFAGCMVTAHSFIALIAILLHNSGYLRGVITREHFHDLGKYMFAFTVFWGYIGFSQYFLIWYASIPEETFWFSYRGHGDFLWLSLLLVFMKFVLPFVGIMSRHIKRNPRTLMFWAVWLIIAEFIDMYWLIQPVLAHEEGIQRISITAFDLLTFAGIGGAFIAVFTWGLTRHPLVPLKDARLEESIVHENF